MIPARKKPADLGSAGSRAKGYRLSRIQKRMPNVVEKTIGSMSVLIRLFSVV